MILLIGVEVFIAVFLQGCSNCNCVYGDRIADRLYLVFEQGLGAAETILRLEYTLTRRIVLRIQAGEPTSAGIFYRRRWD